MTQNAQDPQREVELKFVPTCEVQARLASSSEFEHLVRVLQGAFDLGEFRFEEEGTVHLIDDYYDTAELALYRDHASFRIRDRGHGKMELTIKTFRGLQSGVFDRRERTRSITVQEAASLRAESFRSILKSELSAYNETALNHVLTIVNDRRVFSLVRRGEEFELSLDKFTFQKAGSAATRPAVFEIEIEAKNDEAVSSLPRIRSSIEKVVASLTLADKSKYEQSVEKLGLHRRPIHQVLRNLWHSPNFGTWLGVLVSAAGILVSFIIFWLQSGGPGNAPTGNTKDSQQPQGLEIKEDTPAKGSTLP